MPSPSEKLKTQIFLGLSSVGTAVFATSGLEILQMRNKMLDTSEVYYRDVDLTPKFNSQELNATNFMIGSIALTSIVLGMSAIWSFKELQKINKAEKQK